MTLLCGQSSNLIYMVSLLDFSNSISEMDKFKMFALEQLAKKRPFVPGGGVIRPVPALWLRAWTNKTIWVVGNDDTVN